MIYYKGGERIETLNSDNAYFMPDDIGFAMYLMENGLFSTEISGINKIIEEIETNHLDVKDKTFIDIGANVGTYTIALAPYFKQTFAFEPDKHIFNILCGNVALHNLSYKTQLYRTALSNRRELVQFKKFNELGGESMCVKYEKEDISNTLFNQYGEICVQKDEMIEAKTLDLYCISNVGLIKIDVEGFELNVLKGASETISKSNWPTILVESWDASKYEKKEVYEAKLKLRDDLFNYLYSIGYYHRDRFVGDLFIFNH